MEIADELHGVAGEGVGKFHVRIAIFESFLEGQPGAHYGARNHRHLREKVTDSKHRIGVFPTLFVNVLFQENGCIEASRPLCIAQHRRHLEELIAEAPTDTHGDV